MSDIKFTPIQPSGWARARGYSHAVRAEGRQVVCLAGQTAVRDGAPEVEAGLDFGQQWDRALGNVVTLVREAGGKAEHIVALRIYVTSMDEFNGAAAAVGAAWRTRFGKHFPAMTLVQVVALADRNAKVEVEAEAVLP